MSYRRILIALVTISFIKVGYSLFRLKQTFIMTGYCLHMLFHVNFGMNFKVSHFFLIELLSPVDVML